MNRRTELKLQDMKISFRKNFFSGRYIVRNTLTVLALGTAVGTGILVSDVVNGDVKTKPVASLSAVVQNQAEEGYVIDMGDDSMLDLGSIDVLYKTFSEDEDVLTASNETEDLLVASTDMTGKFIVTVEGLNLRAEASEDGNILDVLYTGDFGAVIGEDGDWTIVSTNKCEGYVKSDYIIMNDEATKVAQTAELKGVSFRDVIGVEEETETAETATQVVEEASSETASTETQQVTEQPTEAVTTSATEAPATEEKTEAPTAEEKTETVTTEEKTEAVTAETTEAVTEATTEATTEEITEAPAEETESSAQYDEEKQVIETDSSDLYLLAAIVYAEAGNQSYEGQLAVASVVMNRVASGKWGSTIKDVIYAPNQFSAVYTSYFTNALSTGGTETSLRAAQDALNGSNNVPGLLSFRPTWYVDTSTLSYYVQIGDHVFF